MIEALAKDLEALLEVAADRNNQIQVADASV